MTTAAEFVLGTWVVASSTSERDMALDVAVMLQESVVTLLDGDEQLRLEVLRLIEKRITSRLVSEIEREALVCLRNNMES